MNFIIAIAEKNATKRKKKVKTRQKLQLLNDRSNARMGVGGMVWNAFVAVWISLYHYRHC